MAAEESQIYHDLMRLKPDDLTPNAWAVKSGVSRTVWTDMRRHGNPSRKTLEKLLIAAGSSLAEFEALRIGEASSRTAQSLGALGDVRAKHWPGAPLPPIPLIAAEFAGEWPDAGGGVELIAVRADQVLEHLSRPVSVASDPQAYALTNVGDAMWPRFRPGRRLIASPASPVAIGDDVLVKLIGTKAGSTIAMVKELVRRTADHVELRQFNPDRTFQVEAPKIASIHKVVGEWI